MFANLAIVITAAFCLGWAFQKLKLPAILGMLCTGIVLGPSVLKFISTKTMAISSELRTLALIVILIRAGLGIKRETLNKVGRSALAMSFIPGILEGTFILFFSIFLFNLPWAEAGMLGFIIAAVSPAVVVPAMLNLKDKGFGQKKEIPTLILAGASLDDVFAITIFGAFLSFAVNEGKSLLLMLSKIPISIVSGIVIGLILGYSLLYFFKKIPLRATKKMILFMIIAILFHELEHFIPVASLLGIMCMGFIILEKDETTAHKLADKFNKIWILAEILLFVLIGAAVDVTVIGKSGLLGALLIVCALFIRSIGVLIALIKSGLNLKEKIFSMIAYLPKATVQAAIGAVPLAYASKGVINGNLILALAVLSIVISAPLGAFGITLSAPYLLESKSR